MGNKQRKPTSFKGGIAVDIVDGSNNIGRLEPDRVEELRSLIMSRLNKQLRIPFLASCAGTVATRMRL